MLPFQAHIILNLLLYQAQRLLLRLPSLILLYDYMVLRSSFGTLGVLSTSLNFFSRMFIQKLLMSLLLLKLGVPVVYLIVKFSPLVIQCIIKIVTQEEEGFYLLFLIIFTLGKFSLLLTWSASWSRFPPLSLCLFVSFTFLLALILPTQ